jgi:hypothetical protein
VCSSDLPRARVNVGKVVVVATTAACWYVGIVALDSDYGFMVTNVPIHGVPYLALCWRYAARRYGRTDAAAPGARLAGAVVTAGAPAFVAVLVALALGEEAAWDRLVWHDHPALFGDADARGRAALAWIVPLLAVPQASHYVLDGLVWRGGASNPELRQVLGFDRAIEPPRAT